MPTQPTTVFLHGAGMGAWVWDRVLDTLAGPSLPLEVPSRKPDVSPDRCADELVHELDRRGESQVILVLHSLAGVLASSLAHRLGDRLAECIFVSGVIPPPGGTFVDALPFPNRVILKVLFALKRQGLKPSAAMIRRELCNDLSEQDAALVVSRYEAELPGLYLKPARITSPLGRSVYIKLLKDQSVPPPLQDAMIGRLTRPRVHALDAGHLAMLSAPAALGSIVASEIGVPT